MPAFVIVAQPVWHFCNNWNSMKAKWNVLVMNGIKVEYSGRRRGMKNTAVEIRVFRLKTTTNYQFPSYFVLCFFCCCGVFFIVTATSRQQTERAKCLLHCSVTRSKKNSPHQKNKNTPTNFHSTRYITLLYVCGIIILTFQCLCVLYLVDQAVVFCLVHLLYRSKNKQSKHTKPRTLLTSPLMDFNLYCPCAYFSSISLFAKTTQVLAVAVASAYWKRYAIAT